MNVIRQRYFSENENVENKMSHRGWGGKVEKVCNIFMSPCLLTFKSTYIPRLKESNSPTIIWKIKD